MQERKIVCAKYLPELKIDLDQICYAVETCWSDRSHIHFFFSSDQYSRERI